MTSIATRNTNGNMAHAVLMMVSAPFRKSGSSLAIIEKMLSDA
jgi:hypothetical protein